MGDHLETPITVSKQSSLFLEIHFRTTSPKPCNRRGLGKGLTSLSLIKTQKVYQLQKWHDHPMLAQQNGEKTLGVFSMYIKFHRIISNILTQILKNAVFNFFFLKHLGKFGLIQWINSSHLILIFFFQMVGGGLFSFALKIYTHRNTCTTKSIIFLDVIKPEYIFLSLLQMIYIYIYTTQKLNSM